MTNTTQNKVEYGLDKVHFAPLSFVEGKPVFETPIAIPGAVTLTGDPVGEASKFYADNMVYFVANINQGYEAKLSIALIPQDFAIHALGEELDDEDGVINEIADALGKPFALLFQFQGDVKNTRHVLYNCTASRPSINGQTKEEGADITPSELTINAAPIEIVDKLMVKTKTTANTKPEIYDSWFTKVYKKETTVPGA